MRFRANKGQATIGLGREPSDVPCEEISLFAGLLFVTSPTAEVNSPPSPPLELVS